MTQSLALLTVTEAEALVLSRLQARGAAAVLSIVPSGDSERSFGWVFEIAVSGGGVSASSIPRRVIVNRHSHQVVASSVDYDVEQFVRLYEKLLAENQARGQQWCGTLQPPWPWWLWRKKSVPKRAKDAGFYEIDAKEGE